MAGKFSMKVLNELPFLNHLIQIEQRVKTMFTWMLFGLSSSIVCFLSDVTKSSVFSYLLKKINFLLYYRDFFYSRRGQSIRQVTDQKTPVQLGSIKPNAHML